MTISFAIVNARAPADYDHGINGYAQSVDASNPVDFIQPRNKIVVGALNAMDLPRTVALRLFYAASCPIVVTELNQATLTAATGDIGRAIVLHLIISCALHCNLPMAMRGTDLLSVAKFTEFVGPNTDTYVAFAKKILDSLSEDAEEMAAMTSESLYCILSFIANCLHRSLHNGHNWFSDSSTVANSTTGRICAIAGAHKVEYAQWMSINGHDFAHVISDESLASLADAMTGVSEVAFPDDFHYGGRNVGGQLMYEVFALPESATDRYPAGIPGKAGVIYGLDLLIGVVNDIASKIVVTHGATAEIAIKHVNDHLKGAIEDRAGLLIIKEALSEVVAFAYGYGNATSALEEIAIGSPSLMSIARQKNVSVLRGAILAKRVKEIEADPKATEGLLVAFFQSIEMALNAVRETAVPVMDYRAPVEISIPLTSAQKRVVIEERKEAREAMVFAAEQNAANFAN